VVAVVEQPVATAVVEQRAVVVEQQVVVVERLVVVVVVELQEVVAGQ